VKLAIMTGRRKSELLNLKWSDIDLNAGVMKLADSKVGPRTFVLSDLTVETLRSMRRAEGQVYVIAGRRLDAPAVGIQKWWVRVRTSAGLSDVTIHTLRHTYASLGAALGQSLHQIGAMLGHASVETSKRYAHLHDEVHRRTSNAIGHKIEAITSPSKSNGDAGRESD
jgi:integrase